MCGIVGFIDSSRTGNPEYLTRTVESMLAPAPAPRAGRRRHLAGPRFRRGARAYPAGLLSISRLPAISRSLSADGRWVIIYNGEIYTNAGELRADLSGAGFAGCADTPTPRSWSRRSRSGESGRAGGPTACSRSRSVTARRAHDAGPRPPREEAALQGRFGGFVFASELKGLRAHPAWTPEIDPESLAAFLRWGHCPHPAPSVAGCSSCRPARSGAGAR